VNRKYIAGLIPFLLLFLSTSSLGNKSESKIQNNTSDNVRVYYIQVEVKSREERSKLANIGMDIENVKSDYVLGYADPEALKNIKRANFKILKQVDPVKTFNKRARVKDFPDRDARFHNYAEMIQAIRAIETNNGDIASVHSIGKSFENRDIWALNFNADSKSRKSGVSSKPGIIITGLHHAREHLSVETAVMYAEYLMNNKDDPKIANLLNTRDIWIVPMVNPDGGEYDISGSSYQYWRKNRRGDGARVYGVDLNRNYGFMWGTGGSSSSPSSDTYMGEKPFSEPETQAVRNFIEEHLNITVFLTLHTYSELILYPWGHKYDSIENAEDLAVYEKMARTMAAWNGYKPQQSSDLYIASGDTTDWAYGEHGIFAFTFELSPSGGWFGGGFYPGAGIIDKVFDANLKPMLYMTDLADDPHRALGKKRKQSKYLKAYHEPEIDYSLFWQTHPI